MREKTLKKRVVTPAMLLVTIGVVYGDIGTSPMYVLKSIIENNGGLQTVNRAFIIGSLSLIIWTVTLITTVKYVVVAMKADNNGEGGIFALYSLVKNYGKYLVIPAMLGGAALLADGVLTPAVTITTAIEGLHSISVFDQLLNNDQNRVILITLIIISVLFACQKAGTSLLGKAFGPIMLVWLLFLGITGVAHISGNLYILQALNPIYAVRILFSPYNKAGFMILGSVFLATTGAEALYSDMGHVGKQNIYTSWPFIKVCLLLTYMGRLDSFKQRQCCAAGYGRYESVLSNAAAANAPLCGYFEYRCCHYCFAGVDYRLVFAGFRGDSLGSDAAYANYISVSNKRAVVYSACEFRYVGGLLRSSLAVPDGGAYGSSLRFVHYRDHVDDHIFADGLFV